MDLLKIYVHPQEVVVKIEATSVAISSSRSQKNLVWSAALKNLQCTHLHAHLMAMEMGAHAPKGKKNCVPSGKRDIVYLL
jgi:hypothetical protein